MESIRNIVIVGGEDGNPHQFSTQIEPVKLTHDSEMAITSLHHGEVFNIHDKNNKVYFYVTNDRQFPLEMVKALRGTSTTFMTSYQRSLAPTPQMIALPEGNYGSVLSICWEIANMIRDEVGLTKRKDVMNPVADKQYNIIHIDLNNIYLVIKGKDDGPWSLIDTNEDQYERFSIPDKNLSCSVSPAVIYANIVDRSYINGKLSQNLGIVPIQNAPQWSVYEPAHPNYVPINVNEFTKILIEIRNIEGEYIKFNPEFITVISLSIRPIKRS